ncbi:hypothetical protein C8J57DRAFT_1240257 [Mycena rebaudengoi]|nr:hypothetical protein C8J57DRAFT_1240257 [Mycena rebaudengoi]
MWKRREVKMRQVAFLPTHDDFSSLKVAFRNAVRGVESHWRRELCLGVRDLELEPRTEAPSRRARLRPACVEEAEVEVEGRGGEGRGGQTVVGAESHNRHSGYSGTASHRPPNPPRRAKACTYQAGDPTQRTVKHASPLHFASASYSSARKICITASSAPSPMLRAPEAESELDAYTAAAFLDFFGVLRLTASHSPVPRLRRRRFEDLSRDGTVDGTAVTEGIMNDLNFVQWRKNLAYQQAAELGFNVAITAPHHPTHNGDLSCPARRRRRRERDELRLVAREAQDVSADEACERWLKCAAVSLHFLFSVLSNYAHTLPTFTLDSPARTPMSSARCPQAPPWSKAQMRQSTGLARDGGVGLRYAAEQRECAACTRGVRGKGWQGAQGPRASEAGVVGVKREWFQAVPLALRM